VYGTNNATAIDAVNPGIAPRIWPASNPINIATSASGVVAS